MQKTDVVIIGGGAAGLMCAIEAGKRGRSVVVLDHSNKLAEKIRISGGGRCNFTNLHCNPANYLGENPRFCVSALKRFSQHDFIELVESYGIGWHEKTLGQLFCNESATDIINMLLHLLEPLDASIKLECHIQEIRAQDQGFTVTSSAGTLECQSLVIATGGPSIPKIGATSFGYNVAKKFGIAVIPPRPALVPLVFDQDMREKSKHLSGLSVDAIVKYGSISFREGLLFTHRGLSGPSILQISSYWREGGLLQINLFPDGNCYESLRQARSDTPRREISTLVAELLPKRLATFICEQHRFNGKIADFSDKKLRLLHEAIHNWQVKPVGTEGYRTAEVTAGGVDTNALSSKTMAAKVNSNLYFIGEVVDITGHLGGFNFQWAWSSGYAAGQYV
ncbi:NAD(P)/FAD-dependent oxidoreductase [Polycladidibacter stylochi]|uniref:NAD(P)/FAD-dependent oxidoreductase n=1 Tax=Polycladidibacter stylochi TaxID=1807766 RepID=UPI00083582A0|nr:NAD(P)/FAD-dependent oxidoreductase [Pseudovibrio stylochi]